MAVEVALQKQQRMLRLYVMVIHFHILIHVATSTNLYDPRATTLLTFRCREKTICTQGYWRQELLLKDNQEKKRKQTDLIDAKIVEFLITGAPRKGISQLR